MRMSIVKYGAAVIILATAAFTYWRAEPSAVVVQISGAVQVQRTGSAPLKATVGLSLLPGDKVIVGNSSKAVLLYKTGRMQTTSESVTIEDAQRDKPGGLFNQTVTTLVQVATTNARTQPNRQGMIRPIQGEPAPIAPRNNIKVADLHPTFTWFKLADVPGYTLQLRRVDPLPSKPERFSIGSDTAWVYPGNASPLIPGATYEWTVAGSNGGRPATVQRFRVMTSDDFSRVAETLKELTTAGIDPLGDGLFLSALAYRDAGLMYDAGRLMDRLEAAGARGRAYLLLRGEVFDALGDLDAAAKAFAAADAEPNM